MIKVRSEATNSEIEIDRYIGKFENDPAMPTVVAFGGVHGNEPSGVFALKTVCDHIVKNHIRLKGNFYALAGNMCALPESKRYCEVDLNRIWTVGNVSELTGKSKVNGEYPRDYAQMHQMLKELEYILERNTGRFYFIDLHTTSSQSCPFIPINDTLANREFALKFPIPTVLGIEEFIDGPLLSYINEIDHVSLGFEGGQHDEKVAIHHHIAFTSLSLLYAGLISKIEFPDYKKYLLSLEEAGKKDKGIYEIRHRYHVENPSEFVMEPGYRSFDQIKANQKMAMDKGEEVFSKEGGHVFMPLYQAQGNDGFFIIRRISPFWLKLSATLRKRKAEKLLVLLPGVKRDPANPKTLIVNRHVARFLARDLFHLLGFRMKQRDGHTMKFTRREKI